MARVGSPSDQPWGALTSLLLPHQDYLLLMFRISPMLEKRWWCWVCVIVSFSSSDLIKWQTRMLRLCMYEYSEVMISKMACRAGQHRQMARKVRNISATSCADKVS